MAQEGNWRISLGGDMNTRETRSIGHYSNNALTGDGAMGAMLFLNRIDWLE